MIRLLTVELTRLRWRRAVLILLSACFLVPALVWWGVQHDTRPVSGEERAQVQAQIDANLQAMQGEIQQCVEHPGRYGIPTQARDDEATLRTTCEQWMGPGMSSPEEYVGRSTLDIPQQRSDSGFGVVTVLLGLLMLVAATFVGHDWSSGSMSNQLLFEPRRLRVWAAKALALTGVAALVTVVALAIYWAALGLVAHHRHIAVPDGTWALIGRDSLRGALLAAGAVLGAYALTMLFRSTVATLGVMFGVSVGSTILLSLLLGDGAQRWFLSNNVSAVLFNGWDYYAGGEYTCTGPDGSGAPLCNGMAHLSMAGGGAFLGAVLLVAVALSLWSFRRRDVP